MSYCVNCGVELEAAQKSCPLCGVVVINPRQKTTEEKVSYPKKRDEFKKKDRIFWFKFISILLAMPMITCIVSDLLVSKQLTWSIYVVAGVLQVWVVSTSPMYFKRFSIVKMLFIDIAATMICLMIIETMSGGHGWLGKIALPICVYVLVSGLLVVYLYRRFSLSGLGVWAAIFIYTGIMMPGLEAIIDLYGKGTVSLFWCWFAIASCLSVAALLITLANNKRFRTELAKRLHF